MESKSIRWLRHAESEANIGLKTPSPESAALTPQGKIDAAQFAASIIEAPETVIVSRFLRAKQTAEPILARFPGTSVRILPMQEFTYLSLHRCRSTSSEDRRGMVSEFWKRSDPFYVDGNDAESFHQFRERIRSCLISIARLRSQKLLVISHALVMQMIRAAAAVGSFDAVSMADFRSLMISFPISNLEVLETRLDENFIYILCSSNDEKKELLSASYRIADH